jgi:zinc protease
VLSYILSAGRSSRLVREIQEEQRLVNSIYSYSYTPAYDAGLFGIGGTCSDDNVDAALAAIDVAVARARNELVSAAEIAKAVKQKAAHEVRGRQTAEDEAGDIGINMLSTGNPDFAPVYLAGIRRVTAADIRRVARRYLVPENRSIVLMRPSAATDDTVADQTETRTADDTRRIVLDNGLRVLIRRNPNVPLVNLRALFFGGVRLEPEGQAGISRIAGDLLTRGAAGRSRDDIAQAFDGFGASLRGSSGNNTLGLEAEVLSEDFAAALAIFADCLLAPAFPEAELETVRRTTLAAIARRHDSWSGEIADHFRREFFKQHPYRHDTLGDAEAVKALTVADIRSFYDSCVRAENGVITVFGDVDADAAEAAVRAAFAGLAAGDGTLPTVRPEPPLTATRTVVKETTKQLAAVYVGASGISIENTADRFPLIVLDAVLSGIGYPGGRLHAHLRGTDRDLVYVVHAFNFLGLEPGYFGVYAASSPEKMDEVVRIIREDLEAVQKTAVPAAELAKAKTICITMEKLSRQTNSAMSLNTAINELYGLGYNVDREYADRIRAVTAADVQRVAAKYLKHILLVRTQPRAAAPPQ